MKIIFFWIATLLFTSVLLGIPFPLEAWDKTFFIRSEGQEQISFKLDKFLHPFSVASIALFQTDVTVTQVFVVMIYYALVASGIAFVCFIVYGGYVWLLSTGNDERVKKARETLIYAVFGLVIILTGYSVTFYLLEKALCIFYDAQGQGGRSGQRERAAGATIPGCTEKTQAY